MGYDTHHPNWYAHVLGIYHMDVWLRSEDSMSLKMHKIEVLYVRWLVPMIDHWLGVDCTWLPQIAFVEESDYDTFGFLDPNQVIRSVHLIPAFVSGHGTSSLRHRKSFARQDDESDNWEAYYIAM
jgi:hypothetical protein